MMKKQMIVNNVQKKKMKRHMKAEEKKIEKQEVPCLKLFDLKL